MNPVPLLPLMVLLPGLPPMIQVMPLALPTSWSLPLLPSNSTLPDPLFARKALAVPVVAQRTTSFPVVVVEVPEVQVSNVVLLPLVAHGKKFTSALTWDPLPKFQPDGPVALPHQSLVAFTFELAKDA